MTRMNATEPRTQATTVFQRLKARVGDAARTFRARVSTPVALRHLPAGPIEPLPLAARIEIAATPRSGDAASPFLSSPVDAPPSHSSQQFAERQLYGELMKPADRFRDGPRARLLLTQIRSTMGPDFAEHDDDAVITAFLDRISGHEVQHETLSPDVFKSAWIARRARTHAEGTRAWGGPAKPAADLLAVMSDFGSLQKSKTEFLNLVDAQLGTASTFKGSLEPSKVPSALVDAEVLAHAYSKYCAARMELAIEATDPEVAAARNFIAKEIDAHFSALRAKFGVDAMRTVEARLQLIMEPFAFQAGE